MNYFMSYFYFGTFYRSWSERRNKSTKLVITIAPKLHMVPWIHRAGSPNLIEISAILYFIQSALWIWRSGPDRFLLQYGHTLLKMGFILPLIFVNTIFLNKLIVVILIGINSVK